MRKRKLQNGNSLPVSMRGRLVLRQRDEGMLAVPITKEQRATADAEMKNFIKRHNSSLVVHK